MILDYEVIRVIRILSFAGYAAAAACTFINTYISGIIILALSIVEIILMCAYDIKIGKKLKEKE